MKKRKRKKPKTYWVWKDKRGKLVLEFSETKEGIKMWTPPGYHVNDWRAAYEDGWRIVKVKVLEVKS